MTTGDWPRIRHAGMMHGLRTGGCPQAFAKGPGPFFGHLTDPDFLHAVRLPGTSVGLHSDRKHNRGMELCTDATSFRSVRLAALLDALAACRPIASRPIIGTSACVHDPDQAPLWHCSQLWLTFSLALVAVPINTLFGISVALLIARNEFPGKARSLGAGCAVLSSKAQRSMLSVSLSKTTHASGHRV